MEDEIEGYRERQKSSSIIRVMDCISKQEPIQGVYYIIIIILYYYYLILPVRHWRGYTEGVSL